MQGVNSQHLYQNKGTLLLLCHVYIISLVKKGNPALRHSCTHPPSNCFSFEKLMDVNSSTSTTSFFYFFRYLLETPWPSLSIKRTLVQCHTNVVALCAARTMPSIYLAAKTDSFYLGTLRAMHLGGSILFALTY